MLSKLIGAALLCAFSLAVCAQEADVAEGEKLYEKECLVCHGKTGAAHSERRAPVRLAMENANATTLVDAPASELWLAIAPPFGPPLNGIYMRPAGTIDGFVYSKAFLKSLKGMEWTEAALDVWIKSPQAWVPGVYMFYKQPDADIRRKIIAYLKESPK